MALALALALLPALAGAATPSSCGEPQAMADGWPVSSPERQGLDGALVCVIGEKLEGLPQRTRTVLLVVVTAGVYDYAGEGGQNLAGDTVLDGLVLPAALGR